jgi:hypothetical protein
MSLDPGGDSKVLFSKTDGTVDKMRLNVHKDNFELMILTTSQQFAGTSYSYSLGDDWQIHVLSVDLVGGVQKYFRNNSLAVTMAITGTWNDNPAWYWRFLGQVEDN